MADYLKSASIIEAELRAKLARLELELQASWPTPIVGVLCIVVLILGVVVGTVL